MLLRLVVQVAATAAELAKADNMVTVRAVIQRGFIQTSMVNLFGMNYSLIGTAM